MSAMGHGCSVTIISTPTVQQLQNCTGRMSWFLLEERLNRLGRQIGDDDGCQDFQLGFTSYRDTTVHFYVDNCRLTYIPCILCVMVLAAGAVRSHYRRKMIVFPLLYDRLAASLRTDGIGRKCTSAVWKKPALQYSMRPVTNALTNDLAASAIIVRRIVRSCRRL